MGEGKLFRQEVIENLKHKHQGTVFQNSVLPHTNLAIWIFIITIGIIYFIFTAEFTEKYTASGYLNADKGVAHIHPPQGGIIVRSFVKQGKTVKTGDMLFKVNTSYSDLDKDHSHNEYKLLNARCKSIKNDIIRKKQQLNSLKPLLKKKYITTSIYQSKRDEISNLKNSQHQIKIDMLKLKKSLTYYIFAPVNGTVTNNIYKVGQYISPTKPIANILPTASNLYAEIFLPVAKSGFINKGAKVALQYAAYPYLRYGVAKAQVNAVGETILTDTEEQKPLKVGGPYYKVLAKLDYQTIKIAGKPHPLKQGMTFKAVIHGNKKKLWQWIFDPLYNFYGKI